IPTIHTSRPPCKPMPRLSSLSLVVLITALANDGRALDHVSFQRDGRPHHVSGKVLVEAQDGGVLLQDPAGVLWAVTADELEKREQDQVPFQPLDKGALKEHLLREMPAGFRIHTTVHYVICYNTSEAYARWCGALFERLFLAFRTFWRERDFDFQDPDTPLAALVFNSKRSYANYAREELGDATSAITGYYSLRTNRVTMYDLTGADTLRNLGRMSSTKHINRLLSQPQAERTVATVIHEATHQLAFNCGFQTRYSDIPLWLSEGIAVYFETPDLRSKRGWRNIGGVNRVRLAGFGRYLRTRPDDSLRTLIANDDRFRPTASAPGAYAEAWALNYFLIRTRLKSYVSYLKDLSEKKPLLYDQPDERIQQFEARFGDLGELDVAFLRYMRGIR
ncbi:MAG: DUF1570 domain-containing protein, partial [Pirellulaceae bacterium]